MTLHDQIKEHVAKGSCKTSLGAIKIPIGYAIMFDPADRKYFWLRKDGKTSPKGTRWDTFQNAKADAKAEQKRVKEQRGC